MTITEERSENKESLEQIETYSVSNFDSIEMIPEFLIISRCDQILE